MRADGHAITKHARGRSSVSEGFAADRINARAPHDGGQEDPGGTGTISNTALSVSCLSQPLKGGARLTVGYARMRGHRRLQRSHVLAGPNTPPNSDSINVFSIGNLELLMTIHFATDVLVLPDHAVAGVVSAGRFASDRRRVGRVVFGSPPQRFSPRAP